MKHTTLFFCLILCGLCHAGKKRPVQFFAADHPYLQYTGRVDFTNPKLPRCWQPGVYITTKFKGSSCDIIVNDEIHGDKSHNYLEIVVDDRPVRLQLRTAKDTISVAEHLKEGVHTLLIVKNTEANIGYIELVGIRCEQLIRPAAKPQRRMEFIGNSITCGTGSDVSVVPCGKGAWQDQHNAYLSYGAITARALHAQYHLSSVSGIGLMHSCCNLGIIMPQVIDKISMRSNAIEWDFSKYQPGILCVCLGQNDGIQDSAVFCRKYIAFINQLRRYYPNTDIICLTSPMADQALASFMKKTLGAIVRHLEEDGDKKIFSYSFSQRYHNGCDNHPNLEEHRQIAGELTAFIKRTLNW